MVLIAYSLKDTVSTGAAEAMKRMLDLEEVAPLDGLKRFKSDKITMIELNEMHTHADYLDSAGEDLIIFLSRHSSAKNIPCFTAHPEGNWTEEAKLGGRPKQLATAAPGQMLAVLAAMSRNNKTDIPVTYEATHHGPFLKTPSLYAEIGGNDEVKAGREHQEFLARCVLESLDKKAEYDKIAIGIGGLHYEDRFARRALDGKYAFSHMMSKYYVDNVDMLEQAMKRSMPEAEIAVIDKDTMNGSQRAAVIAKLGEIGLDYVEIK